MFIRPTYANLVVMSRALPHGARKELGAYYTPQTVVRYLVDWGLRQASQATVMDPSCGDGRFLEEAAELGARRLVGCDVSPGALTETRQRLAENGLEAELVESDFFSFEPASIQPVDVIVGNPPFVRYQRFDETSRRKALESALRLGVRLTRLTSTWAPFLLHAMQFLRPEGQMAMVVPAEITQTQYGLRTLRAVLEHFGSVRLLAFERNVFEDAQVEICLLLASGFGASSPHVKLIPLTSIDDLASRQGRRSEEDVIRVPLEKETLGRFAEGYLTLEERQAWRHVQEHSRVRALASLATVTNGYVTGDNAFFHCTRAEAETTRLPPTWLVPVARSSKSLQGLTWGRKDLQDLESRGTGHHLILPREDLFLQSDRFVLDRWLTKGEERGTPERFKCRKRQPWWQVPNVQSADVFVGYMAGAYPRAAVNEIDASYTNSLHGLRLREGYDPLRLVLGFYTSLSLLSLEIEGRSYGGGILKVEPRELDRVLIPMPEISAPELQDLARAVDRDLRRGNYEEASRRTDEALLMSGLGIPKSTVEHLRSARQRLMDRRMGRSRKDP